MIKGHLTKLKNIIIWTLETSNRYNVTEVSESFEIYDRKCNFLFYYGYRSYLKPLSLMIDFDEKGKLNQPINITIQVSSTSKIFQPEKHTLTTGKQKRVIWSTLDYKVRGSLLIFEMVIDTVLRNDKSVQTSSYIDAYILLGDVSKDFGKLFQEAPDHDVEFICGDETIRAHKTVLSSRSNVFASMLRSDMKEGKTGKVKIQDMQSDILRKFLRCLYTGVLSELTVDTALGFYEASDKYAVVTLKKQCADFLMDNASPENACEILLMADRHSDLDFKKNIIEYIVKVGVPTIGEKWTDFCKENSLLATEVLNLYCQHLNQKLNTLKNE